MKLSSCYRAALCGLLASTVLPAPALAQSVTSPVFRQVDANGVDLVRRDVITSFVEGSIGSGQATLPLLRLLGNTGLGNTSRTSQWDGILLQYVPGTGSGSGVFVDFGTRHDKFPGAEARGSTLTGSGGSYQYTTPDGTVIAFQNNEPGEEPQGDLSNLCRTGSTSQCVLLPTSITSPDGRVVTLEYGWWTRCALQTPPGEPPSPDDPMFCDFTPRLKKVTNSFGYSIAFSYASGEGGGNNAPPSTFHQRTGAAFYNNGVSTTVPQASVGYAFPSSGVTDITDAASRVWRVTSNSTTLAIRRPGSSANDIAYALSSGQVTSVTRDGTTTSYGRSVSGSTITVTVTDALSKTTTVVSDATIGRPTSVTDPLSRTTGFQYDTSGRLTRATMPEGNYEQYAYDARGNVTSVTRVAKSGSGLANIVTSASYPSTCANVKTCNKPATTTDALGSVTDYTYDSTHGGVLTVTAPAPATGAVRPQTRYSYTLTNGEYLLTGVSACQTTSSCTGVADEVKTVLGYDSSGNLTSSASGDGAGTLTATRTMTYDAIGNLLTVDGPLSGTADTIRYRYDAARQLVGTVSPDPDGAGALKHRAVKTTFRSDGQVSKQEIGTVNSQSDTDWAAMTVAEAVDLVYDSNNRPVQQKLSGGGATHALTQLSYDALGRVECSAVRMNPAIYASLPSSACTPGTAGSHGPDRIAKALFDDAGQLTQNLVVLSTGNEAERTLTYTANGLLQTLKDGENNLTTYDYDGHDRLLKTRYPVATKGANASSTTDYEQLGYDANGNVTSLRNRANETIAFTFDKLDRLTFKDLPGTEPDVTLAYDALGRLTGASQSGHSLSFTYDALSRNLTQAGPQGTVASQWDLAGRRTRLTWPGSGLYVDYDHLITGEMTKIRENGATSGIAVLAAFGYDDLGRRTSLTFGNGASQAYTYDGVSRLASLTANLSGTASDLTIGSIAYNPAGQITSQVRSNDAYAFTALANQNVSGTANGLNQLTAVGAKSLTHDAKGNVTAVGTRGFTYSSENLLLTAPGSTSLTYDPMLRLYQQVTGGTTTRFAYDGLDRIAEYNGSNVLQRRYVHGPGMDEPLVWYEGSGTTDRRFLHADERGSIVAVSDASGAMLGINRYDEFGQPQSNGGAGTLTGSFGYTGQAWLAGTGLYYYKARVYDPDLGRFLQPDPIGYWDSPNLYQYVLNDPVNHVDPLGLDCLVLEASPCPVVGAGWVTVIAAGYPDAWVQFGANGRYEGNAVDAAGGGSDGSVGRRPTPPKPQNDTYCEGGGTSTWATVAGYAETIGAAADAGALGAAGIGLVLAPTGAGFAVAELTALGLKSVAFAANATAAVANWQAGNNGRAVGNLVGAAAGAGAGSMATRGLGQYYASGRMFRNLSAGQVRYANYGGGVAGAVAGDAAAGAAAAGCNAIRER